MEKIIHTGIIGFGLSGRVFHAPFIDVVDGFELSKISTANPDNILIAKERYPHAMIVPDGQSIINDDTIDLVIVASPNTVHFHWAKEALLANKHVVVEKPFTVTLAEAQELARRPTTRIGYLLRSWIAFNRSISLFLWNASSSNSSH